MTDLDKYLEDAQKRQSVYKSGRAGFYVIIGISIFWILAVLAFWGAVIYTALHFINKFW